MGTISTENNYDTKLISLKTAHSKRIILCVLPSLVRPATLSLGHTFSVT